jgi:hypothetical protein
LNVTFFKHFYIQGELKGGYINMQDIRTTQSTDDSASQDFFLLQDLLLFEVYLKSSLVVKYNLAVGTQQLFFYAIIESKFY